MAFFSRGLAIGAVAAATALPAAAHASIEGSEGFLRGLSHPVLEPLQGLLCLTAGLLIGYCRRGDPRLYLGLYAGGACAGVLTLLSGLAAAELKPLILLALVLAVSLIVVVGGAPSRRVSLPLCFVCGLAGGVNAVSEAGPGQLVTSGGSVMGGLLVTLYVYGAADWVKEREIRFAWLRFAPRLVASWTSSIAILCITFLMTGDQGTI